MLIFLFCLIIKNIKQNSNMLILACLCLYQAKLTSGSYKYYNYWPQLIYGFKKNADLFINISQLSSKSLVFGLATKRQINNLKYLKTMPRECASNLTFSFIQAYVERDSTITFLIQNDTTLNLQLPSKSTLMPFATTCNEFFSFNIKINIKNGSNHLDYRLQNTMICMLVFSILYFASTLFTFIFYIIYITRKQKRHILLCLILALLLISILTLIIYFGYYNNRNDEYISEYTFEEIFIDFFSVLILLLLYIFNSYDLTRFSKAHWTNFVIGIILLILSIVWLLTDHFVSSSLHLVYFVLFALIPRVHVLRKISVLIYIIGCFFEFPLKSNLLKEASTLYPKGVLMMNVDIIFVVFTTVSIALLLVDTFYLKRKNFNGFSLSQENFSNDEQRSKSLASIENYFNVENSLDVN